MKDNILAIIIVMVVLSLVISFEGLIVWGIGVFVCNVFNINLHMYLLIMNWLI